MKISTRKLSLSFGITWALFVISIGWTAGLIGWGDQIVVVMSSLYRGFDATFIGGLIGGIWGLVDGLIFGALVAHFYNSVKK
jgi:hypothetical protein